MTPNPSCFRDYRRRRRQALCFHLFLSSPHPIDACPAVQLKIVTLQKLFNVVEEEYSPTRLCFRKPATLPMDHEPAMLSLAPREMWQQLLISESLPSPHSTCMQGCDVCFRSRWQFFISSTSRDLHLSDT